MSTPTLIPEGMYDAVGQPRSLCGPLSSPVWACNETFASHHSFNVTTDGPEHTNSLEFTRNDNHSNPDEEDDDVDNEGQNNNGEFCQKQSQVAATLNWLSDNYERAEGVCLPRCVLYTHYLDFCKKQKFSPAGAATFGKIIRQRFPKLTTRRLGTRGQSKYHYYGIGIKESSIYYLSVYSGKGLTRFSGVKIKTEGSNRKYSLSSKTGTLLPEFPEANNLNLPDSMDKDKLETFIMMYRTHCQRILDTVIGANFDEVQNFLLHFWQGMPDHLTELLEFTLVTDIVALSDSILYKVLMDVLIPSTIQDLPDSLSHDIKAFLRRLPLWLDSALETLPESLRARKIEVVGWFIRTMRRQISFVHLAQTARTVLLNHESATKMMEDLATVDFPSLCSQARFTNPNASHKLVLQFFREFQTILSKQSPVESYTEWLDNMVDRCVLQTCTEPKHPLQNTAAEFLLQWTVYNSLVMRDLTLSSASSFGSFHLIHMMLDEYMFLVMETQLCVQRETELQKAVQSQMKQFGEINMQPKIRTQAGKFQNSPKSRKRKVTEELANDEDSNSNGGEENLIVSKDSPLAIQTNKTAFTRPVAIIQRHDPPSSFTEGVNRLTAHANSLPLSPAKHVPSINHAQYDRGSYLPPFNINSYTEFVTPSNSYSGPRILTDSYNGQVFPSVSFNSNLPSPTSTYWPDNRQHGHYADTFNNFSYNKYSSAYDSYHKPALLRNSSYGDPLNRSALEASRAYYTRPQDTFQGTPLAVGGYGANFMDIAPPTVQYGRQEAVLLQEEMFSNSLGPLAAFNKSYLTASFR